ncbi:hypothetical protein CWATWH0003_5377 [Crocosphaera watsonii WH 0003]|uniref:Uncharacterized protein n=1 Tax=Crocosphaera watsonii WH 0003 TaxID=423471 RepID=G5JD79_CROWT|nr:hypothetical protein CWATWH0003_5377 [Crocosphaera watsonii WH 0003]
MGRLIDAEGRKSEIGRGKALTLGKETKLRIPSDTLVKRPSLIALLLPCFDFFVRVD